MPLLIQNFPEAIQYTRVIFDFTMLTQYIPYDDKMLWYIEHALYKLDKTKFVFEYH